MKKLSKIVAVIIAAAMAAIMCIVPASASEMEDNAFNATSGKTYTIDYKNGASWLKFKVSNKGKVKIKVKLECNLSTLDIYDIDANKVWSDVLYWDEKSGVASKTWDIELNAGTYYLGVKRATISSYVNSGKLTITYSSDSDSISGSSSNATIKITMDEGDKISLGALVSGKEKDVTWTSSKKSVAKVSSKGRVSAESEGTATLTAKSGGKVIATVVIEVE